MVSSYKYALGVFTLGLACAAAPSFAVDWNEAASREVTFFFPGSASWEKILTKETHEGATKVRKKITCLSCHEGEQANMGKTIANDSEHPFHRETNGPASVNAKLQIATEGEEIFFRITLPEIAASQLSILLDDNAYAHTALSGCWSSCHDDSRGMDSAGSVELTKYLSASRSKSSRTGGGENYKSQDELQELITGGQYLELIGATITSDTAGPLHGYVLEARNMDESGLVSVELSEEGGTKVLTLHRPLQPGLETAKEISDNGSYTMGMALHLGGDHGASHLVTMAIQFVFDQGGNPRFVSESGE